MFDCRIADHVVSCYHEVLLACSTARAISNKSNTQQGRVLVDLTASFFLLHVTSYCGTCIRFCSYSTATVCVWVKTTALYSSSSFRTQIAALAKERSVNRKIPGTAREHGTAQLLPQDLCFFCHSLLYIPSRGKSNASSTENRSTPRIPRFLCVVCCVFCAVCCTVLCTRVRRDSSFLLAATALRANKQTRQQSYTSHDNILKYFFTAANRVF